MKRIVKFRNGKFGLRLGTWLSGYKFQDLRDDRFYWRIRSEHIIDCQAETIQEIEDYINDGDYTIIK